MIHTSMKVAVFALVVLLSAVLANADGSDCKCWEDFEPEKEGDNWFCRGKKNHRIFGCNEEKPPLCTCKDKGKPVVLDLGETSCASADKQYDSLNCEPKGEWEPYLTRHPEKRLYH